MEQRSSKKTSKKETSTPAKKIEALDEKNLKAFNAIVNFVSALHEEFGAKDKPLALYNRLLIKMSLSDSALIKKHTRVFKLYVIEYKKYLTAPKLSLPEDAKIEYNERIFIDLPRFIKHCDNSTLDVIKSHLLTIASILNPADNEMLDNLEKLTNSSLKGVDTSTKEGAFLGGMMENLTEAMGGMSEGGEGGFDFSKLGGIATQLMSSGVFEDMMGGMKDGMEKGQMDPKKLIGGIKGLMDGLMGQLEGLGNENVSPTTTTSTTTTVSETVTPTSVKVTAEIKKD